MLTTSHPINHEYVILFSFFCSIFISTTQCLAHWGKTYFFFCILLQHPEQCPENLLLMVEVEIKEKKEQPEKQSKSQWAKYSGRQRNRLKQYSMLVKSPVKIKKWKMLIGIAKISHWWFEWTWFWQGIQGGSKVRLHWGISGGQKIDSKYEQFFTKFKTAKRSGWRITWNKRICCCCCVVFKWDRSRMLKWMIWIH